MIKQSQKAAPGLHRTELDWTGKNRREQGRIGLNRSELWIGMNRTELDRTDLCWVIFSIPVLVPHRNLRIETIVVGHREYPGFFCGTARLYSTWAKSRNLIKVRSTMSALRSSTFHTHPPFRTLETKCDPIHRFNIDSNDIVWQVMYPSPQSLAVRNLPMIIAVKPLFRKEVPQTEVET